MDDMDDVVVKRLNKCSVRVIRNMNGKLTKKDRHIMTSLSLQVGYWKHLDSKD